MNTLKRWTFTLLELVHTLKDENLRWQKTNQDGQIKLKHTRVLAAKALEAELKKKSVQLAHEIALLQAKNHTELAMFKTKCKQDLKDYKQYLAALDQLKHAIQSSYAHLPEAVAFTIHHHAKYLLNQMWEAETIGQKMQYEMQLIHFMSTAQEDSRLHKEGARTEKLPARTLGLIQQK